MFKHVKPIFFKAVSGIHAGTGSELGLVDLPIQRERHSGLPKIESSGIKGCIRDEFEQIETDDFVNVVFGPGDDDKNSEKHAGAVAFTDARLLLFPVRSAKGIFAYATCPYIINRLAEDFKIAGIKSVDTFKDIKTAQVSSSNLIIPNTSSVVLEEFTLQAEETNSASELAEKIVKWLDISGYQEELLKNNFIILPNDDFNDFTQNNTEIITRTKIDNESGTVVDGALFTEELLPAETVLYSLVMASKVFLDKEERGKSETAKAAEISGDEGAYLLKQIAKKLPQYIQIGGDASIGKGLCRVNVGCSE